MRLLVVFAVLALFLARPALCGPFNRFFREHKAVYSQPDGADGPNPDPGNPLFLTPYIEEGKFEEARNLSEVKGILTQTSYSGFFTVNKTFDSNMFFWFFPALSGKKDTPLLLWLQGGPGGSSLFGLFVENGPIGVDKDGKVYERPVNWNQEYHMLYIDNPVGTGFSFTNNSKGLSTNEMEVADNLYNALVQFFMVFSSYQTCDFYITGESYAGKYVPAISYKIDMMNKQSPKLRINLVGLAIGDGLVDPVNMNNEYGPLLFYFGMMDENSSGHVLNATREMNAYIKDKKFYDAFLIFDMLVNGDIWPYPTYFYNVTGTLDYYNMLRTVQPEEYNYYIPYINSTVVRAAIHVGSLPYGMQSTEVEMALINDIMDSVADWLASLLKDDYKVLLYNGNLDIIVGVPLTESYLRVLDWPGQEAYLKAKRQIWKVHDTDVDVAGYVKEVGKFQQVVVRNAGHLVPHDQPASALSMLQNFINA